MATVSKRPWTYKGVTKTAYAVRYVDKGGVHRSKQFERKKDADEYKRKVERELDDGTHVARRASRTISDLVEEYLGDQRRRAEEGQISMPHVESLGRALRHASEIIGDVIVADMTWQVVERYGKQLRRQRCLYFDRKLSNGTIGLAMTALSRMVGYAVRRGYAARNVVPDAVRELGTLPVSPIKTFSLVELQTVVREIEQRRPGMAHRTQAMLRAVVFLGAMCGLRKGEILALRWRAINFDRNMIEVEHSLTNRDALKDPKTAAGKRTVPMPRMVAEALSAWRPFAKEDDRGLIFRTATGRHFTDNNFYKSFWHPLLLRAGIADDNGCRRHFHALRHFAGSTWLAGGVSLPEVSRLLGHANMSITARVYSHAVAEVHHQAAALDACAGLLVAQELRIAA